MADVIDLSKKRLEASAHVEGDAFCSACNHEWHGIWPIGEVDLKCPSCHTMRGKHKFDIAPQPGTKLWTCIACDNQLFNLLPTRVHCPGCGKQWGYEELVK